MRAAATFRITKVASLGLGHNPIAFAAASMARPCSWGNRVILKCVNLVYPSRNPDTGRVWFLVLGFQLAFVIL